MTVELFLGEIGKRIALIRRDKHLRQKDVSSGLQMSQRYYQSIEAGRANITLSTLLKIAKFFLIHPTDLLPRKE